MGELSEAYEFLMHIAKRPTPTCSRRSRARTLASSSISESDGKSHKKIPYEFWTGFRSWTITTLRFKYRNQWDLILDSLF